jgi:(p)ppGpp synthase/HD superfamily hydrolase
MQDVSALVFSKEIKKAIRFSIKTHEVYQKQKRKGKDIPYIVHPLTVGLILAHAGAKKELIIAGILHDTIEDSPPEKKATREMIAERFGREVADLVESVTEPRKDLPWEERKRAALEHIGTLSNDAVMLKSADLISNASDILDDYAKEGDELFSRFNAPKEKILWHYTSALKAARERWSESPLAADLKSLEEALSALV